jgi:hypothetical protein
MNTMEQVFLFLTYLSYFFYFVIYFNLWEKAPDYLNDTRSFLQFYVALLLIYFFNPFVKNNFTNFHRRIAFSSGIMLITSISFGKLLEKISSVKKIFNLIIE